MVNGAEDNLKTLADLSTTRLWTLTMCGSGDGLSFYEDLDGRSKWGYYDTLVTFGTVVKILLFIAFTFFDIHAATNNGVMLEHVGSTDILPNPLLMIAIILAASDAISVLILKQIVGGHFYRWKLLLFKNLRSERAVMLLVLCFIVCTWDGVWRPCGYYTDAQETSTRHDIDYDTWQAFSYAIVGLFMLLHVTAVLLAWSYDIFEAPNEDRSGQHSLPNGLLVLVVGSSVIENASMLSRGLLSLSVSTTRVDPLSPSELDCDISVAATFLLYFMLAFHGILLWFWWRSLWVLFQQTAEPMSFTFDDDGESETLSARSGRAHAFDELAFEELPISGFASELPSEPEAQQAQTFFRNDTITNPSIGEAIAKYSMEDAQEEVYMTSEDMKPRRKTSSPRQLSLYQVIHDDDGEDVELDRPSETNYTNRTASEQFIAEKAG